MTRLALRVGDRVRIVAGSSDDGPFRQQVGQTGTIQKVYPANRDYLRRADVLLDANETFQSFRQTIALTFLERIES